MSDEKKPKPQDDPKVEVEEPKDTEPETEPVADGLTPWPKEAPTTPQFRPS